MMNRKYRFAQKLIERESGQVVHAADELNTLCNRRDATSAAGAAAAIDTLIKRLTSLREKVLTLELSPASHTLLLGCFSGSLLH